MVTSASVAIAGIAAALVVLPDRPSRARLRALWPPLHGQRWRRVPLRNGSLVAAVAALLGWFAAGAGGAVSAALGAWTAQRQWARRRHVHRMTQLATELAEAVRRIADELRTGAHPAAAVAGASHDGPAARAVLAPVVAAARLGESIPTALARQARDHPETAGVLDRIGRAWAVADRHGVPLADLLSCVHAELAWRLRYAARVRADLAGPRATAAVLTALPVVGLLLGQLTGADPVGVLRHSVGQVLLAAGVGLTVAGAAWSERILSRAVPT